MPLLSPRNPAFHVQLVSDMIASPISGTRGRSACPGIRTRCACRVACCAEDHAQVHMNDMSAAVENQLMSSDATSKDKKKKASDFLDW